MIRFPILLSLLPTSFYIMPSILTQSIKSGRRILRSPTSHMGKGLSKSSLVIAAQVQVQVKVQRATQTPPSNKGAHAWPYAHDNQTKSGERVYISTHQPPPSAVHTLALRFICFNVPLDKPSPRSNTQNDTDTPLCRLLPPTPRVPRPLQQRQPSLTLTLPLLLSLPLWLPPSPPTHHDF